MHSTSKRVIQLKIHKNDENESILRHVLEYSIPKMLTYIEVRIKTLITNCRDLCFSRQGVRYKLWKEQHVLLKLLLFTKREEVKRTFK